MTSLSEGYYNDYCRFTAVIEDPDGITYCQQYDDFDQLLELKQSIGPDYWIIDIFANY